MNTETKRVQLFLSSVSVSVAMVDLLGAKRAESESAVPLLVDPSSTVESCYPPHFIDCGALNCYVP